MSACRAHRSPPRLKISRRGLLSAACALGVGATLAGCEGPVSPLRVGSIVFPGYEFMFLAREMGQLDPGLVRLVELQSSSDTMRALAAGQLEAGALTLDEMMTARAEGIDLKAVLVFDSSFGADQVLTRPGITLKNLKNHKVAVEDNSVGALVLAELLDAAEMRFEQLRKVPMTQGRAVEFYQRRRADVIVTAEPWASQLRHMGAQLIYDSRQMPGLILDVLAVRSVCLATHASNIRHMVDMHFLAQQHFRKQADQASLMMAGRLQAQPAGVAAMFDGLYLPEREANIDMLVPKGHLQASIDRIQKIMLRARLMRVAIDPEDLTDSRFVRPAA